MRNLTVNLAIAVTISGFFAVMLSAQAAKGAAQLQSETTYAVAAARDAAGSQGRRKQVVVNVTRAHDRTLVG
jgi:hypothetical protein